MAAVLPVALVDHADAVMYPDGQALPPVPEPDFPSLPVSTPTGFSVLVVARLVTFLAPIPACALIFIRHRRAVGRERVQLRWLLWAAIICAIAVAPESAAARPR